MECARDLAKVGARPRYFDPDHSDAEDRFILLGIGAGAIVASAAHARAQDGEDKEYGGKFVLIYEPIKNQAFHDIEAALQRTELFEEIVDALNQTIALPTDIEVVVTECDTANAFYDPEQTRIVMCYELIQLLDQEFAGLYETEQADEQAVADATAFVFQHEMGHALVDVLELPITGKEEDAVDDLATLVLLHGWEDGDESALNAAAAFYLQGEEQDAELEELPYWDEHSLGLQRYYQIACVVYGFNPDKHAELVGEDLPQERAQRCPAEYEQKASSWEVLLADYWKDAGEADQD